MYFDYTATTKMDEEVLKLYIDVQNKFFANTTSLHSFGQKCNSLYEKMKNEISNVLDVDHKIIFTSNATEANNLGILGLIGDKKGKLITTKIEHPSVFEVFKKLETIGYEVIYLDVDEKGIIKLEQLENELNKETILVSIMWVNNIVGGIQPIDKIINIVKKYPKCKLHVDCVQGMCKLKPNFKYSDIDAFTFSAHKFYGPKGIGGLVYKKGLELVPRLFGSNVQEGLKPGTFDLGLIAGCAKALKKYSLSTSEHYNYVKELNKYIRDRIQNNNIVINSSNDYNYSSPYIINISVPNILGETVVHIFEEREIYVSTGSACSSKLRKPEKTIYAMTNSELLAKTTVRISLSHLTTYEEADALLSVINSI